MNKAAATQLEKLGEIRRDTGAPSLGGAALAARWFGPRIMIGGPRFPISVSTRVTSEIIQSFLPAFEDREDSIQVRDSEILEQVGIEATEPQQATCRNDLLLYIRQDAEGMA